MSQNIEITELKERFDNELKSLIDKFNQLINHPEKHLDDYISTVKNDIDIHREENIQEIHKIHKISANMISELDTYYQDCLNNLPNLKQLAQKNKDNLVELRKNLNEQIESKIKHGDELDDIEDYIKEYISINREEMQNFEYELQMNLNYSFQPVKFFENFGKLEKKTKIDELKESQNAKCFKTIKSFNSIPKNKNKLMSCDLDIFNDYKLVIEKHESIYNIQTAEVINDSKPFNVEVLCPKWINKSLIAVGSDLDVKILDLDRDGECIQTFSGHSKSVISLCFFKKKNHLISGSLNGEMKIWDLNENKCFRTLNEHKSKIDKIMINSKDFLVSLSFDDQEIKVWNTNENYNNCYTYKSEKTIQSINLHPNGNIICISEYSFELFDFLNGRILFDFDIYEFNSFGGLNDTLGGYLDLKLGSINFLNDSKFVSGCNYSFSERDGRPGAFLFVFDLNSEDMWTDYTLQYYDKEIRQISLFKNNCILVLFLNKEICHNLYFDTQYNKNFNHFEVLKIKNKL
jgi:WD40 repeat protein